MSLLISLVLTFHPYSKIGTSVSISDQGAKASSPLIGYV